MYVHAKCEYSKSSVGVVTMVVSVTFSGKVSLHSFTLESLLSLDILQATLIPEAVLEAKV